MDKQIIHLLMTLKELELNFERLYKNVADIEGQYNPQLKAAATVLSGQEKLHAQWYASLIENLSESNDCDIDPVHYLKAREILKTFKTGIRKRSIGNTNELISFAVYYEKLNAQILKEILEDITVIENAKLFELLNTLIVFEVEHSATLLRFLKPTTSEKNPD